MNSPTDFPNQITLPPVDMVMPETPNLVFTYACFILFVLAVLYLLRDCIKQKAPLPMMFLIGGLMAFPVEGIFDFLNVVWYPHLGATTPILRIFNVSISNWAFAVWGFYIGGQGYIVYHGFVKGMSLTRLWGWFWTIWLTNLILEVPSLA